MQLENQIKRQQRTYDQSVKLKEKNLISDEEFETARDEYQYLLDTKALTVERLKADSLFREIQIKQLEANLDRMQSNLAIVKERQDNLTLRAPVSGLLTSHNAEIGELKTAGASLGQIDVLDGFKIVAGIDEHWISRVEMGRKGTWSPSNSDTTYSLTVIKVYQEVISNRFEVDMVFDGEEPTGMRRGQSLHIRLELGDLSEAVLLPRGGFYQKTGGQWIFIVDPTETEAYKRKIRLGRQNPQVFEVLEGLEPGERVITSSYDSYGDIDKLILR
jgi:HlyD family secretion protein